MSETLYVKIKKEDERAVIPTYAHNGDVGMDMTAISCEYDSEKDLYIYDTGLSFESNFNVGQFLFPRSSNRKTEAYLTNSVGIADSAIYRGRILFCYKNRDSIDSFATKEAIKYAFSILPQKQHLVDFWEAFNSKYREVLDDAKTLKFAPYKAGERIGQMVFMNYPTVNLIISEELSDSERGTKGFGSTGN